MKLYGGALSPFVMRAMLAARAKGHELTSELFPGGIKSAEYLVLNPIGKMPVLVDEGFALPESAVIAEYLDEVLPGPSLAGGDPMTRARVRLVARVADLYVAAHLGPLFQAMQKPDGAPGALAKLAEGMGHLEALRDAGDAHAVGDAFTLADAALIPLFFFFDAFDRSMGSGRLIADRPGLAAWWDRAKASPIGHRAVTEMTAALKAFREQPR